MGKGFEGETKMRNTGKGGVEERDEKRLRGERRKAKAGASWKRPWKDALREAMERRGMGGGLQWEGRRERSWQGGGQGLKVP